MPVFALLPFFMMQKWSDFTSTLQLSGTSLVPLRQFIQTAFAIDLPSPMDTTGARKRLYCPDLAMSGERERPPLEVSMYHIRNLRWNGTIRKITTRRIRGTCTFGDSN